MPLKPPGAPCFRALRIGDVTFEGDAVALRIGDVTFGGDAACGRVLVEDAGDFAVVDGFGDDCSDAGGRRLRDGDPFSRPLARFSASGSSAPLFWLGTLLGLLFAFGSASASAPAASFASGSASASAPAASFAFAFAFGLPRPRPPVASFSFAFAERPRPPDWVALVSSEVNGSSSDFAG